LSNEKNEVNIRTKSVQENMVSNIMVEFLFMTMIKGLALGFGIFYMYELDIEIKRIINVKDINNKQEDVLNEMLTVVIWCGVFNFATLVYQLIFYGIRLFIACKRKSNFFFLQEDHLKKKNKNDVMKRISAGNISLPETNEDNITYEKLDK
jgi:dipeptide/tripeptide permease